MEAVSLNFRQGDLLLVPFPYSNLSATKVRPVLVVSNNQFNAISQDLIVCCVTSNISKGFYSLLLHRKDLIDGKLMTDCCIKIENIAKIEKSLIIKKIGRISAARCSQVSEMLFNLFRL